jgi:hypothetical protein
MEVKGSEGQGRQLSYQLRPIGKDGHWKKHSTSNAPQADEQPFGGVTALEQQ